MRDESLAELPPENIHATLELAFQKFHESSERLEQKYTELLQETECLREQIREKEKAIKRAERLAMLGETAAGIAHEVRNPLGSISLFLSLLKDDIGESESAAEIIEHMETSVHMLDRVVSNILQFSRETPAPKTPLNLFALVQEQVAQLPSVRSGGVRVAINIENPFFVLAEELAFRQVIFNLFLNSQQAMKGEGEIVVQAIHGAETDTITIRDTGPGIPEELLDRIFDPFVTSKNEGTGLGLALVRRVIEGHGGTIRAENKNGAFFEITIPRKERVKSISK